MNKIILIGRLTRDVEMRMTSKTKKKVASFSLAVNRKGKTEDVDFIDCVAFEPLANICEEYLSKGMKIAIDGTLNINSYEDKDGNLRKAPVVIINDFYFCEPKKK